MLLPTGYVIARLPVGYRGKSYGIRHQLVADSGEYIEGDTHRENERERERERERQSECVCVSERERAREGKYN
jgi:hypothetical protein